jgi:hypothetical protein
MPLGNLYDWAKSNGRIGGMKLHVVYNPKAGSPGILDINDAQIIETGAAYVFDKGYCHYGWWTAIAEAGASFAWLEESHRAPRHDRFSGITLAILPPQAAGTSCACRGKHACGDA